VTAPSGQGLNIAELGQSLFDFVVQAYSAAGSTAPLPGRQIIAAGDMRQVAWDCEQMSVSLAGIGMDVPDTTPATPGRLKAASLRHAAFVVQVVRCAAVGITTASGVQPPKAEQITAVGTQALRDAGLVSQALFEWCTRAVSTAGPMGILAATPGDVVPVGPEGGYVAVEGSVMVSAELLT